MGLTLLYLPFFLIRLGYFNLLFLGKVLIAKYRQGLSVLFSLTLLTLYLGLWWAHQQTHHQQLLNLFQVQQHQQQQQLREMKAVWLHRLESQPTHRDLLYNVAQITCELQDSDCELYLQAAQHADPNSELFHQ